ncbi:hypothetical protein E2C00_16375 [Streptomyces sp. WAC05374]|uniref:hypothetical protein n=1 Tax=Streptomyces sp. WAC05374 TaxID=2487420 RepID=UPI000F893934|nr:hypothetical protein [Streptomyces sp. WAC05374]RST05236.1 hypothetical protein EF905_33200 [Streptomyces sp. WAC05374]TDF54513.1 hypothetical protein E2C00_16375 [Streptomyces sp. WAC05374]TDF56148.1 hypothetical protein E2C02_11825 [Streptomyces sp. WAC05374]
MSTQLREAAGELAGVLWREHTVYRERSGGVVIRGEHVRRWISLAPAGGRDEILLRAGRILDGGTTAPARSEAVMPLSAGTAELAAACRRLLAETAADAVAMGAPAGSGKKAGAARRPAKTRRPKKPRRSGGRGRHTGIGSWIVLLCVGGVIAYHLWSIGVLR